MTSLPTPTSLLPSRPAAAVVAVAPVLTRLPTAPGQPVASPLPTAPGLPGLHVGTVASRLPDALSAPQVVDGFEEFIKGRGEVAVDHKATPVYRQQRSGRAAQITLRDIQILRSLLRYKFMTYGQLASEFDMAGTLMRRMPKLQRAGLVTSMATGSSKYLLWRCTELGAEMSGLNLANPRKVSETTIAHDLGLVDLGTAQSLVDI